MSQFSGEGTTLRDFIPVPDVYPAGRLDKDSEGLLLLTSDGELQHRLTDPRFGHPRTYWVQVEGVPSEAALQRLASGLALADYRTRPAKVRALHQAPGLPPRDPPVRYRASIPDTWIEITLTEGKNRQVRHMTAAVGHPTLRLVRAAIGSVRIEGLERGRWRAITESELASLLQRFPRHGR